MWLNRKTFTKLQDSVTALEDQLQGLKAELENELEDAITKRLQARLRYWLQKEVRSPNILIRDNLLPKIGSTYTLLEESSKTGGPVQVGGNINLVNLDKGDVVEISCTFTDEEGNKSRYFHTRLTGPLADPFFIIDPIVVTSDVAIIFKAVQGHSRSFTYTFYRWTS